MWCKPGQVSEVATELDHDPELRTFHTMSSGQNCLQSSASWGRAVCMIKTEGTFATYCQAFSSLKNQYFTWMHSTHACSCLRVVAQCQLPWSGAALSMAMCQSRQVNEHSHPLPNAPPAIKPPSPTPCHQTATAQPEGADVHSLKRTALAPWV